MTLDEANLRERAQRAIETVANDGIGWVGLTGVQVLALLDEIDRLRATLARVEEWTHMFGALLKPKRADTYGEGMRDAKAQVSLILRNDHQQVVRRG